MKQESGVDGKPKSKTVVYKQCKFGCGPIHTSSWQRHWKANHPGLKPEELDEENQEMMKSVNEFVFNQFLPSLPNVKSMSSHDMAGINSMIYG